jgi:hypothetical protein
VAPGAVGPASAREDEMQELADRRASGVTSTPCVYRVEIAGGLPAGATAEFPGMSIRDDSRTTALVGVITDGAALYGLVARLEALGVVLVSLQPELDEPVNEKDRRP